jgi:hypothetical protein
MIQRNALAIDRNGTQWNVQKPIEQAGVVEEVHSQIYCSSMAIP